MSNEYRLNSLEDDEILKLYELFFGPILMRRETEFYLESLKTFLNKESSIEKVVNKLNECDAIIFSYPVYTFIAPSQLHRFIELLKENNVNLENKFVTQITTSKHFYDMTAHKYIEENCYDLKMKYVKGLSQDMEDLTKKEGQLEAINFFKYFINSIDAISLRCNVKYSFST